MKLTVRFPDTTHARLSEAARVERRSLNQWVVDAVEQALEEREPGLGVTSDSGPGPAKSGLVAAPSRSSSARIREIAPPLKPFHTDFKKG